MKKLILFLCLIVSCITFSFHIVPSGFEKRIDNGEGYQEFYFPNKSSKVMRYKFEVTPGSEIRGDMSPWVEIYPKILTIKPGETGMLKVYAKAPKNTPDGEYGFFLYCIPIAVPTLGKEGEKIEPNVAIKILASIEMVGYVGNLEPNLKIVNHRIFQENDVTKLEIKVKNDSIKRGVDYLVEIKGKNNTTTLVNLGRIYEGQTKTSTVELKNMKLKDPYEIKIIEDINYKEILKMKI
ncbi:MAG: hypothetical protein ACRC4T_27350 [Cetobacterium sp.]